MDCGEYGLVKTYTAIHQSLAIIKKCDETISGKTVFFNEPERITDNIH